MTFQAAVRAIPEIQDAWKAGLQALRPADRQRIVARATRQLRGSVDLDSALRDAYPNAQRWDYGIAIRPTKSVETILWVEIHPATDGEIRTVLAKLAWIKEWLRNCAPSIDAFRREFIWISSGNTSFTQRSPQAKRMAQAGLRHVGRLLIIP